MSSSIKLLTKRNHSWLKTAKLPHELIVVIRFLLDLMYLCTYSNRAGTMLVFVEPRFVLGALCGATTKALVFALLFF